MLQSLPEPHVLMANIAIAAAGVTCVLFTIAKAMSRRVELYRLKLETHRLRDEYDRRLAILRGEIEPDEVEVLEPEEVEIAGTVSPADAVAAKQAAA